MITAIYGGGKGPFWLGILVAAEEWGCPPWEIAGGDKMKWYFRWQEYAKHRAKKQMIDSGEALPEE